MFKISERPRVVFMGTPLFAVPTLRAINDIAKVVGVVTNPDRRSGRGRQMKPPPVKEEAERLGIPVLQPKGMRAQSAKELLRGFEAELFIVVAYGRILPSDVLQIPSKGCVNVHASLLPRYRGAAPINWALINDEKVTGVSIMKMDEGMDTGPVLATKKTEVSEEANVTSLSENLSHMGAELLSNTLSKAAKVGVEPVPQDNNEATYARMLTKEDGLLDWNMPARDVAGRIRGTDPWPGAFTYFRGEKLRLFSPRVVAGTGIPGEVLRQDFDSLVVACGEDAVALKELQFPSKKRMDACCLLCGCAIQSGCVLGLPQEEEP